MRKHYPTNWERWLYQALCTADCIRGGYLGYEQIGRTNVCVGIRDGAYVMETVADVRERLGE